jgi:hypothetical protein
MAGWQPLGDIESLALAMLETPRHPIQTINPILATFKLNGLCTVVG